MHNLSNEYTVTYPVSKKGGTVKQIITFEKVDFISRLGTKLSILQQIKIHRYRYCG